MVFTVSIGNDPSNLGGDRHIEYAPVETAKEIKSDYARRFVTVRSN